MKTDKDTRQKLEEDARAVIMGGYVSVDDVRGWLDRQAAITRAEMCGCPGYDAERHYCKYHANDFDLTREQVCDLKREVSRLERERDELQAKLDAYEQTHMLLPVDADGVPIRPGDKLAFDANDGGICTGYDWAKSLSKWMLVVRSDWDKGCVFLPTDKAHHVKPRTIENVLREFYADYEPCVSDSYVTQEEQAEVVERYADELRGLMGGE